MCQLFETIKILGGEPQNLSLHEERMNRSRNELFGCDKLLKLSDYIAVPDSAKEHLTRCRVIYSDSIESIEFTPYFPADIKTLKMVNADLVDYKYKYLDRSSLSALIDKKVADDILMIKNDYVTDTSFANIVFTNGKIWITPDTPLLRGTMREFLLRKGTITTGKISIDDIRSFTHFRLINAMLGFDSSTLPVSNII